MSTLTDRYYHESRDIDTCKDWREISHEFQADMVDAIIGVKLDGMHCELALVEYAMAQIAEEKRRNYRKRAAQRVRLSRIPATLADGLETPMEWYLRAVQPFTYAIWKESHSTRAGAVVLHNVACVYTSWANGDGDDGHLWQRFTHVSEADAMRNIKASAGEPVPCSVCAAQIVAGWQQTLDDVYACNDCVTICCVSHKAGHHNWR